MPARPPDGVAELRPILTLIFRTHGEAQMQGTLKKQGKNWVLTFIVDKETKTHEVSSQQKEFLPKQPGNEALKNWDGKELTVDFEYEKKTNKVKEQTIKVKPKPVVISTTTTSQGPQL